MWPDGLSWFSKLLLVMGAGVVFGLVMAVGFVLGWLMFGGN